MDERLYTISVTKAEVEWVLNKKETEEKIRHLENEEESWKEYHKNSVKTLRRLLSGIGYDPDDNEDNEILTEDWFAKFEEKFKSK